MTDMSSSKVTQEDMRKHAALSALAESEGWRIWMEEMEQRMADLIRDALASGEPSHRHVAARERWNELAERRAYFDSMLRNLEDKFRRDQ